MVDRTFFRERYDYARALQALARSMTSLLDLEEITAPRDDTVEAAMHVRERPAARRRAAAERRAPSSPLPPARSPAIRSPPTRRFAALAPAGAGTRSRALGAEVVVPLRFQERPRGAPAAGRQAADAPYTAEDLSLLETLADQTAVAVANAEAHRPRLDYARSSSAAC